MIRINPDCTTISYNGGAVLPDYENVESYVIKGSYNNSVFVSANIDPVEETLPTGIEQELICTDLLNCTCETTTEDIYGDLTTDYDAPEIIPIGFKRGQAEVTHTITLGNNTSFRSLVVNGTTILSTTDNLLYSADYSNLSAGFSPELNRAKLETDLQNAFLGSALPCKVDVKFNEINNSFTIELNYLQATTSIILGVTEYTFASGTTNTFTINNSATSKTYEWDRLALKVDNYDRTNTRKSWWSLDGTVTELVKSGDTFLFYNKQLSLITGHNIKYHVITNQGQYIIYNYQVTALYNTLTNVWTITLTLESTKDGETGLNAVQQFVEVGAGEVVGTRILSCESSATSEDSCTDYFQITPQFFNNATTATKFADGVYTFDFIITLLDGSCIFIRECVFVGCSINCKLIEMLSDDVENQETINLVGIYNALQSSNTCNLSCSEITDLFNYLNTQVNGGTSNTTTESGSCNC